MSISVSCPSCGHNYTFADDKSGKQFHCKGCGALVRVPEAAVVEAELVDDWGDDEDEDDFDEGDRPFAPPKTSSRGRSGRRRNEEADWIVTAVPAIFLMVISGIALLWAIVQGISVLAVGFQNNAQPGMNAGEQAAAMGAIGAMLFLNFITNSGVLLGGYHMLTRGSYRLAMVGVILAMIPCLSPCIVLGIPFGIWGLVVLLMDSVRHTFKS